MTRPAPRPRVLLVTSGPLDGPGDADTDLAADIVDVMVDAEFLWFTRGRRLARSASPPPVFRGRPVHMLAGGGPRPYRGPGIPTALRSASLARRVDLVHAVVTIGPGFPLFSRYWPRLVGATPVLHTVPGVVDPALPARSRPLGLTVALSDVTAWQLDEAGFGEAGFGEVRVVPPMIRPDLWPLVPRPAGPLPTVLVTGHHDPLGGAEDAIQAAAVAVRIGARLRLVLALRGRPGQDLPALERKLREQAALAGLHGTEVLGRIDGMKELLTAADVLLFLPRPGGGTADVPLTALQALATGRPTILSDLPQFGALRDAVLRTPPGDPRRAGYLLRQLLDRPWWWQSIAEHGRVVVEEVFGPERFRAGYAALYEGLLLPPPAAP